MSQPQSRIPETMVADILGEAARLHSETHKGYSLAELEKICEEANIPPHLVQQAHENLEKLHSQRRSQRQQWRQVAGQFVVRGLRLGLVLVLPTLVISRVVWFRPQLTDLFTAGVAQLQPSADTPASSVQVSTQLESLNEEVSTLQQTLTELKADRATPESQPDIPALPPPLPESNPASASLSREVFQKRVMGKTESQVVAAVGRPLGSSQYGSSVFWDYDSVLDTWTGQEGSATVILRNGKVEKVTFRD